MRDEFFCLRAEVLASGEVVARVAPMILGSADFGNLAHKLDARIVGPGQEIDAGPHARNVANILDAVIESGPVNIDTWEPDYGRLAEAQVKWEAAHGRPLGAAT
jgi:hypothetical protein